MRNPASSSLNWWEENWPLVNGLFLPQILPDPLFIFCGCETEFIVYWPLIRLAFDFATTYKRIEFWHTSEHTSAAFWEEVEVVAARIKNACKNENHEDFDMTFRKIKNDLDALASRANQSNRKLYDSEFLDDIPSWLRNRHSGKFRLKNKFLYIFRLSREVFYRHTFERYKLKARLVYEGVDSPPSGKERAFK